MGEHQCPNCGHITTGFEKQDYVAARNAVIEECAQVVDMGQETITEKSEGSVRHLTPRIKGNLMGTAYADGIRALHGVKE